MKKVLKKNIKTPVVEKQRDEKKISPPPPLKIQSY